MPRGRKKRVVEEVQPTKSSRVLIQFKNGAKAKVSRKTADIFIKAVGAKEII